MADTGKLSRGWILAGVIAVAACATEIVIWWHLHPALPKILNSRPITNDQVPKDHLRLSPDGSQLYFNEFVAGQHRIMRVSVNGGEVTQLTTSLPDPVLLDVSRQSELLVNSTQKDASSAELWILDITNGSARRAGDITASDAVWLGDGRLMFVRDKEFFVADHDGANAHKRIRADGPPFEPHLSPDGLRVRFTIGDPKSSSTMWESRIDGSGLHPILPLPDWKAPPAPCCGSWTPNGKYFTFANAGRIWVMADTPGRYSEPVELTSGPLGFHDPVPSPDGKKLFAVGIVPRAELAQLDSLTGQFMPFPGNISAGDVDFSPDGQWMTYVSYPDGALWRSKVDGSEKLQLTSPPMQVATPRWSTDIKRVAFSGAMPDQQWKVWSVSKDGGNPEIMTPDNLADADPAWSPEGDTLAFVRFSQPSKIELLDLNGSSRTELEGSSGLWHIRWSPDGCCIAALFADSSGLAVYERSKKKWRTLADKLMRVEVPSWSHDSKYLYFTLTSAKGPEFVRVRVSDGKLEPLASLKGVRRYLGLWGSWSGLAPGDVPLLALDTGQQEVYTLDWRLP